MAISGAIARAVKEGSGGPFAVAAIYGEKSLFTYAGIIGIHCAGKGYVPLLPSFPDSRLVSMLDQVQAEVLVLAKGFTKTVSPVLELCTRQLLVVCEDKIDSQFLANKFHRHRFTTVGASGPEKPTELQPEDIAYLLFTSGSTGKPKGVPVHFSNLLAYLRNIAPIVRIGPGDRCSQTFNLTFDLSVHDIFVTLCSGACLFPLDQQDKVSPAMYIRKNEITCWFSVPAVAMLMERTRTLKPNVFPSLKFGLFCGEAFPIKTAEAWNQAASEAKLLNLYGPTEATIAISAYWWSDNTPNESRNGVVPIGTMLPNQQYKLINDSIGIVGVVDRGELVVVGDQVTSGYLNLPEESAKSFVVVNRDSTKRWYRTGDLVEEDESGCLHFIRRVDNQIQVQGFRVELEEVEHHLRLASASDLAIALAINEGSVTKEIVSVVARSPFSSEEILTRCADLMPTYMTPSRVKVISDFPLNSNGKIDRQVVLEKILNNEIL